MGTRRGVVCELHDWSADSEFTELLKGRYITDVVDDEILVLDNGMWLHVETEDEGRVLRTQALGEYADKMFDSMMRSILHMSMLHGPACDLGDIFIPAHAIEWIEIVED